MRYLAERGRGLPDRGRPGSDRAHGVRVRPRRAGQRRAGARRGLRGRAGRRRSPTPFATGRVGAGPRRDGREVAGRASTRVAGGLGSRDGAVDDATSAALAVVNAVGDVIGRRRPRARGLDRAARSAGVPGDAPFEEHGAQHDARRRRDRRRSTSSAATSSRRARTTGWRGRCIPSHTRFDGDLAIALATGGVETHFDRLRVVAADVVAEAIRDAVRIASAVSATGPPRRGVHVTRLLLASPHPAPPPATASPTSRRPLACMLCKLPAGRTQVVFGVGHADADLLFVGEGPGEQEDLRGEPFVGRAGQLLTSSSRASA